MLAVLVRVHRVNCTSTLTHAQIYAHPSTLSPPPQLLSSDDTNPVPETDIILGRIALTHVLYRPEEGFLFGLASTVVTVFKTLSLAPLSGIRFS